MEDQQTLKIQSTYDYGKFKFLKGNRDLSEKKIKRIIESVENGLDLFKYCPIMINKDDYVIDGQHRFYASKLLKKPVYFVIVQNFSLRQVAEMNQNASKWTDKDFLNCYIDTGNHHYSKLKNFCEKYHINLGIASALMSEGKVRGIMRMDDLRDGLFKADNEKIATAFMDKVIMYEPFCKAYRSRNFLQALESLFNNTEFDHLELVDKLKLHNLEIETKSSPKEYLQHMEDLFNFKNSKRKRIY